MEEIVKPALREWAEIALPRLLTQVCRDPSHPAYGCFDRNWWHYKIRDFPSIILQQGGYALWCASRLPEFAGVRDGLEALAAASVRFWHKRAIRHGAFEEYYPWERGYPPLAFSTLSVCKLVHEGLVPAEEIREGLLIAARQLETRFEPKAANQQVAGLAALAWVNKILPGTTSSATFESVATRTLALQDPEGWYMEYGGPDTGYLAVTIDCLWDLWDATNDRRFLESARSALRFTAGVVAATGGCGAGMHNARNTDYLVPYGIMRFSAAGDGDDRAVAAGLARRLFSGRGPGHFFAAVDDRYWSHYIGWSLFRSLALPEPRPEAPLEPATGHLPSCGYVMRPLAADGLLVSTKKGGVFSVFGAGRLADFGWIVDDGRAEFVSHWWTSGWNVEVGASEVTVSGHLVRHVEVESTPVRHMALRVLSFFFGSALIPALKNLVIFKKQKPRFGFRRTVRPAPDRIVVEDVFTGLGEGDRLRRAPRSSKRHVASADSFHAEDFSLLCGWTVDEKVERSGSECRITTAYTRGGTD